VTDRSGVGLSRWWLIAVAVGGMGAAGTYQFGWSSIRGPLGARIGAGETALGTVFTLFVVFQTVSQFPAGWVRDRYGPRLPLAAGAVLMAAGYVGTAFAPGVAVMYVAYAVGGVGSGATYSVMINTPVKWFDDRRGLATGLVASAYAAMSFVFIILLRGRIETSFVGTLLAMAAAVGVLALVGVPFLRDPGDGEGVGGEATVSTDGTEEGVTRRDDTTGEVAYTWRDTVRTWQFWLLYAVLVVVNGVGLMIIGKVVAYADAMALPAAVATAAASLVALGDGVGGVVGGALSDGFGRERTIALSLVACGACLAGASLFAVEGVGAGFVALIVAAAFFRSPVFAVFPGIVGEYYGTSHSSENYAALYSAKLWGGVVGGTVTSGLIVSLGWNPTFRLGAGLLVLAGVAMAFLRPLEADVDDAGS
jgi:OFA family oxalate/formate antiporter-like MFS transporter